MSSLDVKKRNIETLVQDNERLQKQFFELKQKFNLLQQNQQSMMIEFVQLKSMILVHRAQSMGRGPTS